MAAGEWLTIGRVGGPFGVKGWVHVESYADPPSRLLDFHSWRLHRGEDEPVARQVIEAREHGKGLIARLEGVVDRNAAARLKGAEVAVPRNALPPLKAREFYQADLIGLPVTNLAGTDLGAVRYFVATPGGAVMVVQQDGRERWIPAMRRHLRKIDLAAGRVVVDWPAEFE